jgi:hypothetical protein
MCGCKKKSNVSQNPQFNQKQSNSIKESIVNTIKKYYDKKK